jgi:ankyrin repeat protein
MSDDYDYYSSARWRRDRELIRAVRRNRFDDVRMHLEHGADINAIDKYAWRRVDSTALLAAASGLCNRAIVIELLKYDHLDVNFQNLFGDSALLMASDLGVIAVVEELLKHDQVDVNLTDRLGDSALGMASKNGKTAVVVELLKHEKVNVNFRNCNCDTPLHLAIQRGHTSVAIELLKCGKANLSLRNAKGSTALFEASVHGYTNLVWELLKQNPYEALGWTSAICPTEIVMSQGAQRETEKATS